MLKPGMSSLPDDHEIGYGKFQSYNEEKGTIEDIGWRTYYLYSKAEITGDVTSDDLLGRIFASFCIGK